MLTDCLARDRVWSASRQDQEPDYTTPLVALQSRESLWILCSGRRPPAKVVMGLDRGAVLVHRNVANIAHYSDMYLLSALDDSVASLMVREIKVCGHYGCGAVTTATKHLLRGLVDHWLHLIQRLAQTFAFDPAREPDIEGLRDRLAEFNVVEVVRWNSETLIRQTGPRRRANIPVHGLISGLMDGRLRDLECSIGPGHFHKDVAE